MWFQFSPLLSQNWMLIANMPRPHWTVSKTEKSGQKVHSCFSINSCRQTTTMPQDAEKLELWALLNPLPSLADVLWWGSAMQAVWAYSAAPVLKEDSGISTIKSKTMILSWKRVECLLWVKDKLLSYMRDFRCLVHKSTRLTDWGSWTDLLWWKELSIKEINIPTLTYGPEQWIMIKRMRLRIQAAERSLLRRVAGLCLTDRSSVIQGGL